MTQTATDPASTDPATDPGTDPAGDPQDSNPGDPGTDPQDPADGADPRVQRANREAANYRTQLRATEAKVTELEQALQGNADTLAKLAAVFNPEAGNTDADPAEQLATITGEVDNLRGENTLLRAELAVHSLAAENGGNPNALLDSRAFTNTLAGLDPSAEDYRDKVAQAIKDAVSKTPTLAAAGQGPSRGGAPGAGQGSAHPAGAVTQEQFDAMDYRARTELFRTNPDLYRRLAG